jgi:hypothetical protein
MLKEEGNAGTCVFRAIPAAFPTTGRKAAAFASEWVAGINRNQWALSPGIAGRIRPEYALNPPTPLMPDSVSF